VSTSGKSNNVDERLPAVPAVARFLCEFYLAGVLVGAAFWWWLMPGGFPISHSRFWLNSVAPIVVVVATLLALAGMLRRRYRIAGLVLLSCAAAWAAIAIYGRVQFPFSLSGKWILGMFAAGFAMVGWWMIRRQTGAEPIGSITAVVAGTGLGAFVMWAEVPPRPTTNPSGEIVKIAWRDDAPAHVEPVVRITESCRFYPNAENLVMTCGGVTIHCSPLVSFDRISPDGFWSLFAPRKPANRKLQRSDAGSGTFDFNYSDGSTIKLLGRTATREVELTANSIVAQDAYSHLNSYCTFDISGHKKLSLAFSPCVESKIEVPTADYPFGRPARFAYVDAEENFHVVEATSGEKGPFRTLALGKLRRDEPLTITICDDGKPVASVEMGDWSRQLSTTLSPTAGWGVPVNAIEFRRDDSPADAPVNIWVCLAATSVGRGWDCVGHRAGVYRNRLRLRDLTRETVKDDE
jgi:hypothetical protein